MSLTQNELKRAVAQAATTYVKEGEILGVGTGSTVDFFIDAIAPMRDKIPACVSSSVRSTKKIKGGGGALTREKIVASISDRFVCIADASKKVDVLGRFPLPVEVIPMAARAVQKRLEALGATVTLRDFVTDNGCHILDAAGLSIEDPEALEAEINSWPGVVTVGLFAARGADVLLLGTASGVETFVKP